MYKAIGARRRENGGQRSGAPHASQSTQIKTGTSEEPLEVRKALEPHVNRNGSARVFPFCTNPKKTILLVTHVTSTLSRAV